MRGIGIAAGVALTVALGAAALPWAPAEAAGHLGTAVGQVAEEQVADRVAPRALAEADVTWTVDGSGVHVDAGQDVAREVARALLDARSGPEVVRAIRTAALPADQQQASAEMSGTVVVEEDQLGPVEWLAGTADVDGDELPELLVVVVDGDRVELQARDGVSGAARWRAPAEGWASATPLADLDGDGVREVLVQDGEVAYEYADECDDGCESTFSAVGQLRDRVLDGRTGAERWARSVPVDVRGRSSWSASSDYEYEVEGTGAIVLTMPAADGRQLVGDVVDLSSSGYDRREDGTGLGLPVSPVQREERGTTTAASTRAALLDARDGTELLVRQTERAPAVALLQPSDDLSGDGAADLLWLVEEVLDADRVCTQVLVADASCEGRAEQQTVPVLQAVDGADLGVLWERRGTAASFAWQMPLGVDLDGGGAPDVLVLTVDHEQEDGWTTTAVAGESGGELWSRDGQDWLFPLGYGDVDGGPGTDVIGAEAAFDADGFAIRYLRVDGRGGAVLLATDAPRVQPVEGEGCAFGIAYAMAGDLDGDGVDDPHGGEAVVQLDEECREVVAGRSLAAGESGRDGTAVYRMDRDDSGLFAMAADDLDGDGGPELLATTVEEGAVTESALALPGLQPRWSVELAGYLLPLVDVDGDGGVDLLEAADDGTLRMRSGVDGQPFDVVTDRRFRRATARR